jgi:hypothetical protein
MAVAAHCKEDRVRAYAVRTLRCVRLTDIGTTVPFHTSAAHRASLSPNGRTPQHTHRK